MFLFVLTVLGLLMVAIVWFQIRAIDKRPAEGETPKLGSVPRR